ncbi:hypothetical protein MIND_00801700 [Mycena indigotica]|uniref:Uncharacterized protein n=1 Tax=Mycena indigotica TaxID=2126181 RepID=A0A8H6SFC4_9AGAR|nr:uncharacterized protein MIND_00801700 [Mycena indigotica]KAF7298550.1 hypothetical protein MIND_00801700 [Mycena indigotica]
MNVGRIVAMIFLAIRHLSNTHDTVSAGLLFLFCPHPGRPPFPPSFPSFRSFLLFVPPSAMNVVVDDRDPAVQYFPNWRTKDLGRAVEFASTTSNPAKHGDAAQLTFSGTSISVFGTIAPGNGQSSMDFSIDDGPATTFQPPPVPSTDKDGVHHQPLFASTALSEGSHTIRMTSSGSDISQIFLDYFLVRTTEVAGKKVFIDDADTNLGVVYGGLSSWAEAAGESYFGQGVHVTQTPGAWVAVTFQGTQLTLQGPFTPSPDADDFSAFASIDNGSPISLVAPPTRDDTTQTFNNRLFATPLLPFGTHTVNFTYTGGPPLAVDYFLVSGAPNLSANGNSDGNGFVAGPGPSLSVPPSPSPTNGPGSSPQQLGGASARAGPNMGAIAGGIIAGVVLVALLVAGIFLFCRRRRARKQTSPSNSDFFVPSVTQWAGKSDAYAYNPNHRDSMMTLTNGPTVPRSMGYTADAEKQEEPPDPRKSRYLYYPEP